MYASFIEGGLLNSEIHSFCRVYITNIELIIYNTGSELFGGIILTVDKSLRVCEKGHKFYKSSECKSCPTCDKENKPKSGFLSKLSAPARNAFVHEGIDTLKKKY